MLNPVPLGTRLTYYKFLDVKMAKDMDSMWVLYTMQKNLGLPHKNEFAPELSKWLVPR